MAVGGYCTDDCPGYVADPRPPHYWSEHDDARHYTNPVGWAKHYAACSLCNRSLDDD
jgi:hypothetical protein